MCSKEVIKEIQIRSFDIQKTLFFFGAIIIFFASKITYVNASNQGADLELGDKKNKHGELLSNTEIINKIESKTDVESCTIESIQKSQSLYENEEFAENYDELGLNKIEAKAIRPSSIKIDKIDFNIIKKTPHDINAFTQGLVYYRNYLYESTGGLGVSDIRKVAVKTGQIIKSKQLPDNYFAEGLVFAGSHLIQLTLKKNLALIYNVDNLMLLDQFKIPGDGWGLAEIDGDLLISDGTSRLLRINAKNHLFIESHQVTAKGVSLDGINEMEIINGMIYANIWPTDCIAIIEPVKFQVQAWINLSGLYPEKSRQYQSGVLNGIAYDESKQRLLVTGKNWPYIYHLKLDEYPVRH